MRRGLGNRSADLSRDGFSSFIGKDSGSVSVITTWVLKLILSILKCGREVNETKGSAQFLEEAKVMFQTGAAVASTILKPCMQGSPSCQAISSGNICFVVSL